MENTLLVSLCVFLPPFLLWRATKTRKGALVFDKYILKIPMIGTLIHKTIIEVYCRVFYTLYSGSAESIEPIRIAAEATDNKYFEDRIKSVAIPLMVKRGTGITDAFAATGVFTETSLSRLHSGEETGTIKNTSLQLANYYESETVYKLKNLIELIQVIIAMVIMVVMIALTLVSAETATVRPKSPGVSHKSPVGNMQYAVDPASLGSYAAASSMQYAVGNSWSLQSAVSSQQISCEQKWFMNFEVASDPKFEIRNSKFEILNPQSEIRKPVPTRRDPKFPGVA